MGAKSPPGGLFMRPPDSLQTGLLPVLDAWSTTRLVAGVRPVPRAASGAAGTAAPLPSRETNTLGTSADRGPRMVLRHRQIGTGT